MNISTHNNIIVGKILLLPAALLVTPAVAQVRVSIGPTVGANLSSVRYKDIPNQPGSPSISYRGGINAGLVASIEHQRFALWPTLLFSMQGFVLKNEYAVDGQVGEKNYYHQEYRFNYLKAPINVSYSLNDDGIGFQVLAGVYASLLLGGKVKYNNRFETLNSTDYYQVEQPVRVGSDFPNFDSFYSKRFDTGVQAGIGYSWKSIAVQATYQLGLINVGANYPSPNSSSPKFYNRSIDASLSYFIFKTK